MPSSQGRWGYEPGKFYYFYSFLKLENYEVLVSELQKTSEMLKVHLSLFLTELMKKCFTVLLQGKLSDCVSNTDILFMSLLPTPPQTLKTSSSH